MPWSPPRGADYKEDRDALRSLGEKIALGTGRSVSSTTGVGSFCLFFNSGSARDERWSSPRGATQATTCPRPERAGFPNEGRFPLFRFPYSPPRGFGSLTLFSSALWTKVKADPRESVISSDFDCEGCCLLETNLVSYESDLRAVGTNFWYLGSYEFSQITICAWSVF